MVENLLTWTQSPDTARWILAISIVILIAAATRQSHTVFWGDLFAEEGDED